MAGTFALPVETIIYRLVQEALTNIGKHADPTQVSISAQEENHQLRLVIEDDGHGFEMSEVDRDPNRGMGLAAMRDGSISWAGLWRFGANRGRGRD